MYRRKPAGIRKVLNQCAVGAGVLTLAGAGPLFCNTPSAQAERANPATYTVQDPHRHKTQQFITTAVAACAPHAGRDDQTALRKLLQLSLSTEHHHTARGWDDGNAAHLQDDQLFDFAATAGIAMIGDADFVLFNAINTYLDFQTMPRATGQHFAYFWGGDTPTLVFATMYEKETLMPLLGHLQAIQENTGALPQGLTILGVDPKTQAQKILRYTPAPGISLQDILPAYMPAKNPCPHRRTNPHLDSEL